MSLLLLMLACRKPAAPPTVYVEPTSESAPAPTGALEERLFRDGRYPLTVSLPPDWTGEVGVEPAPQRFTAVHAPTGTQFQAIILPEGAVEPASRPDCAWNFIDTGGYRDLAVNAELIVATCTPRDPTGPRVFAVLSPRVGLTLDLELSVPNLQLAEGRAAGDVLLRAVRLDLPVALPPTSAPPPP